MCERLTGCSSSSLAKCTGRSWKRPGSDLAVPGSDCDTHIDFVLLMSDEEVVHHASFVEIPKADHVLYPLHRGRVHQTHHVHVPSRDPVLLTKAKHGL